jgi:hypothetical protein
VQKSVTIVQTESVTNRSDWWKKVEFGWKILFLSFFNGKDFILNTTNKTYIVQ